MQVSENKLKSVKNILSFFEFNKLFFDYPAKFQIKTNRKKKEWPKSNKICEYISVFGIFEENIVNRPYRLFNQIATLLTELMLSKMFFGCKFEICRLLRANCWLQPNIKFMNCQMYFFLSSWMPSFDHSFLAKNYNNKLIWLHKDFDPIVKFHIWIGNEELEKINLT